MSEAISETLDTAVGAGNLEITDVIEPQKGKLEISGTRDVGDEVKVDDHTKPPDFRSLIPDEYKDRPYLSDVQDMSGLLSKLEGAQKLAGKKKEELLPKDEKGWEEFYKTVRPDSPEAYEFNHPEELGFDEELSKELKGIYHKHGASKKQAENIQAEIDATLSGRVKDNIVQYEKLEEDFTKTSNELFGGEKEQKLAIAKKLLDENVPPEFAHVVTSYDNKQLIAFCGTLNNLANKYISPDRMPTPDQVRTGGDLKTLKEEMYKAMDHKAYENEFHPEHEQLRKQVQELARSIARLGG